MKPTPKKISRKIQTTILKISLIATGAGSLGLPASVFAEEVDSPSIVAQEETAALSDKDVDLCNYKTRAELRTVRQGFRCKTNQGVIFELAKRDKGYEVWKDTQANLYISHVMPNRYSLLEASKICTDPSSQDARGGLTELSWSLPSGHRDDQNAEYGNQDSDFAVLDRDGFLQVIPDIKDRNYWSLPPKDGGYKFYYELDDRKKVGYIFGAYQMYIMYGDVICVGRPANR